MNTTKMIVSGVALVSVIGGLIYAKRKQNAHLRQLAQDVVMDPKNREVVADILAKSQANSQAAVDALAARADESTEVDAVLDASMTNLRNKAQQDKPTLQ